MITFREELEAGLEEKPCKANQSLMSQAMRYHLEDVPRDFSMIRVCAENFKLQDSAISSSWAI